MARQDREYSRTIRQFYNLLVQYVERQTTLLEALKTITHDDLESVILEGRVPDRMTVGGEVWLLSIHGAGVAFHASHSRERIDVHTAPNMPDAFDAWRIMHYLGSLGKGGDVYGLKGHRLDHRDIEKVLEQMIDADMIEPLADLAGHYRVKYRH